MTRGPPATAFIFIAGTYTLTPNFVFFSFNKISEILMLQSKQRNAGGQIISERKYLLIINFKLIKMTKQKRVLLYYD